MRYSLSAGYMVSSGPAETVVSGLPLGGDHPMHPFYIADDGMMYVDVATATNACQEKNRTLHSPAGRYVTGIRNAEGFGIDKADNHVYFTQHGRDQLHANWPEIYKPEQEA